MPLSTRRALMGAGGYADKVLGTGPIAYWPLDEGGGTVARCLVNTAQNGTYTAVTLANDATGAFGTAAPWFDGATSFCNIFSAAFDAAFSGATGSAMIWAKVNAAAVWTDGATRRPLTLLDDADNDYNMQKTVANNTLFWRGEAGAGVASFTLGAVTINTWLHMAMTWSDGNNADQFLAYLNAASQGAAHAGLNAWNGGGLDNTKTLIGASTNAPLQVWHGWLAHCAIWNRVLSQAEITALANP